MSSHQTPFERTVKLKGLHNKVAEHSAAVDDWVAGQVEPSESMRQAAELLYRGLELAFTLDAKLWGDLRSDLLQREAPAPCLALNHPVSKAPP